MTGKLLPAMESIAAKAGITAGTAFPPEQPYGDGVGPHADGTHRPPQHLLPSHTSRPRNQRQCPQRRYRQPSLPFPLAPRQAPGNAFPPEQPHGDGAGPNADGTHSPPQHLLPSHTSRPRNQRQCPQRRYRQPSLPFPLAPRQAPGNAFPPEQPLRRRRRPKRRRDPQPTTTPTPKPHLSPPKPTPRPPTTIPTALSPLPPQATTGSWQRLPSGATLRRRRRSQSRRDLPPSLRQHRRFSHRLVQQSQGGPA